MHLLSPRVPNIIQQSCRIKSSHFIYTYRRKMHASFTITRRRILSFLLFVCFFLLCSFFLVSLVFFLPPVITPNLLPSLIPDDDWTFCACLALAHVGIFSFCPRVD
ncbi:hypothetical protein EDD22DRAFT_43286 [Suillus occidentalis]|nr:hypothetical protein EDD22DRAFT_43286 [Suillus occidentalis]